MKTLQAETHNSQFQNKELRFNHRRNMRVRCISLEIRFPPFQKGNMNPVSKQSEAKKNLSDKKEKIT